MMHLDLVFNSVSGVDLHECYGIGEKITDWITREDLEE